MNGQFNLRECGFSLLWVDVNYGEAMMVHVSNYAHSTRVD